MFDSISFTDLCTKQLELCAVHEGETVAVLSQMDERIEYADAFMAAARRLGATPFHVRLPEASSTLSGDSGAWMVGATPLATNRPAVEALKQADIVIDLMFLLFSREQLEITESGTRIAAVHGADRQPHAAVPDQGSAAPRRDERGDDRQRQHDALHERSLEPMLSTSAATTGS